MTFKFNPAKKDELKKLISLIVEMYDPAQILLFGSQARGTWTEDSDFDILVIDGTIKRSIGEVNSQAARNRIDLYFDALKTTTEDMIKFKNSVNHVLAKAQREGVVLYDKKNKITVE